MEYLSAPLQNVLELERFVQLLREEKVRSYLEIGSKFGGSFWRVVTSMPPRSRAVAVDLPAGTSTESLQACVQELKKFRYRAQVIFGDSTDPLVIKKVSALAPFDCVFIDANHTLSYLEQDFRNYAPMARMVAFHDIMWQRAPEWRGTRIDVRAWWEAHRDEYRHEDIVFTSKRKDNGIGVLWMNRDV